MVTKTLDIGIHIVRAGKNVIAAHSRGRTVNVRAYYAREGRYIDVRYGEYLQYNAMRIAHRITNDIEMVSINDYYQVRDVIESMLKTLHEHSTVRMCITDITVSILEDNDNEEHD